MKKNKIEQVLQFCFQEQLWLYWHFSLSFANILTKKILGRCRKKKKHSYPLQVNTVHKKMIFKMLQLYCQKKNASIVILIVIEL
jgi:hypothetical protein